MSSGTEKLKILFLCTGNSCRSQMAEGWTRRLQCDTIEAHSAGTDIHRLNPDAVRVMAEAGVDISSHYSKHVDYLGTIQFDYVVTICDSVREACPRFPGAAKTVHRGFDDPPLLARRARTEAEALDIFRRVRDEIRAFVEQLPQILEQLYQSQHCEEANER